MNNCFIVTYITVLAGEYQNVTSMVVAISKQTVPTMAVFQNLLPFTENL